MAQPSGNKLVAAVVVGVVAIQALMLFAFAWPASNSGPREVPIAVAGPPEAVGPIEQELSAAGPDADTPAFDVTALADESAAIAAIQDRDVYGAIVVSAEGPELLVATGASPAVAQMLRSAAGELAPPGGSLTVTDVVPGTADDPSGSGLAAGILPLVMTSAAAGLAAVVLVRRTGQRLALVGGLAVVAGIAAAALIQPGLGITDGSYWPLAGMLALIVGAITASVAGLGAVLGRAGAGLGMLLMIFLGNPLSAAVSAPEMLPQPWGAVGQLMPPGAGATGVRSVSFFDSAAIGGPLLVLGVWLVAGLALILLGGLVARRSGADDETETSNGVPVAGASRPDASVLGRGETADRSSPSP